MTKIMCLLHTMRMHLKGNLSICMMMSVYLYLNNFQLKTIMYYLNINLL